MMKFLNFNSPKRDPYGKLAGRNPFLVEINSDGTYQVISGSVLDKPGALKVVKKFDTPPVFGLYSQPRFYSKIVNCFTHGKLAGGSNYFVPSGFNYGYSHSGPTPPAYHFNRRHFGHFSDMVETPGDSATIVAGHWGAIPPVKVKFISRAGEVVDPAETNSQNLSVFCTSSKPYDEGPGQLRDRKSIQPDLEDVIEFSESVELNLES